MSSAQPQVHSFFDSATSTITHVIHAGKGSACAVVDSVLDFDAKSGRTRTDSADQVIAYIHEHDLKLAWILETHAHADHLSAAPYLKKKLGGKVGIGENIKQVQNVFKNVFNLEPEFAIDGSQFDHLFQDNERFQIGELHVRVMFVPGHTPACSAYVVEGADGAGSPDCVFVGDTMFMPDVGTARCDFPGGDANTLYQSMQKLLTMPPETKLYLCHDYPPAGREVAMFTTVVDQRARNIHVHDGVSQADFVAMRTKRDASLAMPNLILPSIQVNIRAGHLPPVENNGVSYLKLPLNAL